MKILYAFISRVLATCATHLILFLKVVINVGVLSFPKVRPWNHPCPFQILISCLFSFLEVGVEYIFMQQTWYYNLRQQFLLLKSVVATTVDKGEYRKPRLQLLKIRRQHLKYGLDVNLKINENIKISLLFLSHSFGFLSYNIRKLHICRYLKYRNSLMETLCSLVG